MAFNFLGTIESLADFEAFEEFVKIEVLKLDRKILHIKTEIYRFNLLLDKFKVADLKMRAEYKKSDQPDADWLNDARSQETPFVSKMDASNAIIVDYLKTGVLDAIKYKRERNEFKIKRINDLVEQLTNEIANFEDVKLYYIDKLNTIRNRFDLLDYDELSKTAPVDPADFESIRKIEKDFGRVLIENVWYYKVLKIDASKKSITFENIAPPVKYGDTLILKNGKNDGTKTVLDYLNSRTIQFKESMIEESSSNTLVSIKK